MWYRNALLEDISWYKLLNLPKTFTITRFNNDLGKCLKFIDSKTYGYSCVYLSEVPACCGELFMSNLSTHYSIQKKGYATRLVSAAIRLAELGGYSAIRCLVNKGPGCRTKKDPIYKILEKTGFVRPNKNSYKNIRTTNTIEEYIKVLKWPENWQGSYQYVAIDQSFNCVAFPDIDVKAPLV